MSRTVRGATQWTLRASSAVLRDADGAVELQSPRMSFLRGGLAVTELAARRGVFHQGSQDVHLEGAVRVVSGGSRAPTVLETEALEYRNASGRFETDRKVLVSRGKTRMRGEGLTATRDLSEIRVRRQETEVR